MAKVIRRYWWIAALQVLLIAGAAIFITMRTLHHATPAIARDNPPSTQPTITPLIYSRVRSARQSLALTNSDLAAMGCDQTTATGALTALLSWYQAHETDWVEKQTAVHSALAAVTETQREIHVGPANETLTSQLATQKAALDSANAAWSTFIATAASAVQSSFSQDQATIWTNAQTNRVRPSRYRYVSGIEDGDFAKLQALLRKRGATSPQLQSLEESVLNSTVRSNIAAAISNQEGHMAEVVAADQAVLPQPIPPQINR